MLNYCTHFNVSGGRDLLIHGFSGWRSDHMSPRNWGSGQNWRSSA